MRIALVEPYFGGSHRQWCEGLQQHLPFDIQVFSLPARHWKWHLHGGSLELSEQLNTCYPPGSDPPNCMVLSSMTDLSVFRSRLAPHLRSVPAVYYFHENQLCYPWSPGDADPLMGRDLHYSFIHYASALSADEVWFNSGRHRSQFLEALRKYLKKLPDCNSLHRIDHIAARSKVLHLGLDLIALRADAEQHETEPKHPTLLWNHRWEYDKNPEDFFETLFALHDEGLAFSLVVTGEHFQSAPGIFQQAQKRLNERIMHFGYCQSRKEYATWLGKAHLLPVSSAQDFFGVSVVEAMACGVIPLLPKNLAYEEHVDDPRYFYDRKQFKSALRSAIEHWRPGERFAYRDSMLRYDWSRMASDYVTAFEALDNKTQQHPL